IDIQCGILKNIVPTQKVSAHGCAEPHGHKHRHAADQAKNEKGDYADGDHLHGQITSPEFLASRARWPSTAKRRISRQLASTSNTPPTSSKPCSSHMGTARMVGVLKFNIIENDTSFQAHQVKPRAKIRLANRLKRSKAARTL